MNRAYVVAAAYVGAFIGGHVVLPDAHTWVWTQIITALYFAYLFAEFVLVGLVPWSSLDQIDEMLEPEPEVEHDPLRNYVNSELETDWIGDAERNRRLRWAVARVRFAIAEWGIALERASELMEGKLEDGD